MSITVTAVTAGAASFDALADAIGRAKAGDALAPVAVLVPTNTAGVMARRALGRRGGAAGVDILTLYRLAELLGSPDLLGEGRRPVSTPVVDLAVKHVLRRRPGPYRDVAEHPSTVVALRDLYREIRLAGPSALAALARTARGREPARVAADVARQLAPGWYDEGDLLERAADRVATTPRDQGGQGGRGSRGTRGGPNRLGPDRLGRLGRIVIHQPERLRPLELALVAALGAAGHVEVLLARTGNDDADAGALDMARRLGVDPGPTGPVRIRGEIEVLSTTDADDEVRLAVRAVVDAARAGTRFDRIALLWPADRPYARLVEHHLGAAGVPWNGRPGTGTAERMVPRVLAELLELDRRGLRRTPLMSLLGDVPARDATGRPVPTARWERIGRRAGIIREPDWDAHLPAWIDTARRRESADVHAAEALRDFVTDLRTTLGDAGDTRPWADWVAWSHDRLDHWFGPGGLDRLDTSERAAWEHTQRVLDRLGQLDAIGDAVTRAEFRATFMAELDTAPARQGTVGDGVHVGALSGARGLDVDMAVVLGAADGLLPPPPPTDPLLGDAERAAAGLVTSDERVRVAHRQFLAVVTTTPRVVITVPRGDLRATTVQHPSRWLHALGADERVAAPRVLASHTHGLTSTEFPVSAAEHRLRELWTRTRSGEDIRDHPLATGDPVLAGALRLRDARAGDEFTEYDGDLSGRAVPRLDAAVSPTRIELWAQCPHAYFVQHVLGVRPVDEPEDIVSITPLDRGSAIHAAIDRLQRRVLDGLVPPPGPDGWTDAHLRVLRECGEEVAQELERSGRTGRRAYWAIDRAELLAELECWIGVDTAEWNGRTLRLSEQTFGDDEPVTLALPGGRRLAFRGQIDRVDELPDGTIVVTDHKTGSADRYRALRDDPTGGGTRFQLPVYAAAARVLCDRPTAPVHARYAFFGAGAYQRIGVTFDGDTWRRVGGELAAIVDGIEGGVFPAIPPPPGYHHYIECHYCEPDRLGTAEAWAQWQRKQHDPRLARWFGPDADATPT